MRCEEKTGFLMLHRCESVADDACCYCGKKLCSEHTFALDAQQAAALAEQPISGRALACLACFRQHRPAQEEPPAQQSQPEDPTAQHRQRYRDDRYADPYDRYPYYGGYYPYIWGHDYSARDRSAFERASADPNTGETGATALDS